MVMGVNIQSGKIFRKKVMDIPSKPSFFANKMKFAILCNIDISTIFQEKNKYPK